VALGDERSILRWERDEGSSRGEWKAQGFGGGSGLRASRPTSAEGIGWGGVGRSAGVVVGGS